MAGTDPNTHDRRRPTELEDLIVQLDCTLADLESSRRKGYLSRDLARLRTKADRIRVERRQG